MKPRTLWACQSVALIISANVAPLGRFNRSMIFAALLPSRADPAVVAALGAFFSALAFLADLALAGAGRRTALEFSSDNVNYRAAEVPLT